MSPQVKQRSQTIECVRVLKQKAKGCCVWAMSPLVDQDCAEGGVCCGCI